MSKAKVDTAMTFERHEKKYMLDARQYGALMAALEGRMQQDEYGEHTICTLYYDTDDYAVIRRCREKPAFRTKLRLRSYGVPTPGSIVYLELKKKLSGITYKRRVPMPLEDAMRYMDHGLPPRQQGQIFGEIDWYTRQQPLSGQVVLCYDRIAMFGTEDPQLRITIDANIRWRDYSRDLSQGDYGALLLPNGHRLMEIKTLKALPYWLSELLAGLKIYPQSFSKYGTVFEQYLQRPAKQAVPAAARQYYVCLPANGMSAATNRKEVTQHVG